MARLEAGYVDRYEAGTRRERGYMCGIASIYKDDSIKDAATITATVMQESTVSKVNVISEIEVFTQDIDFDLSDDELAFL